MIKKFLIYLLLLLPLFFGCSEKFDINQLGNTKGVGNANGDTVYVHINPDWGGFNNPRAILVGKEPFIYVCDTDNNRIVMLNTAGTVLGSLSIERPIAISQDYRLNLIVCAQTEINSIPYSAVYKINLFAVNHIISNANLNDGTIKLILPRAVDIDLHPKCTYSAVTAFYDNSYDIARTGTNNTSIYDPDNAILRFEYINPDSDAYRSTLPSIDALSSGLITANGINSMMSFSKKNLDFIATFDKNVPNATAFKAQWFQHYQSEVSEGYQSEFSPSEGMAFVQPGRFGAPTGSCIDPSGNIFVADGDSSKDSVFKFSAYGDELQSFGGSTVFSKPTGVAFFDQTLYVLDSKLNVIKRFILSTDLGQ
jgi:DNA-binding beta-propeller fold protein YncE